MFYNKRMSKQIHWYPGHMKKAQNEIEAKLKIVDCIIELLDARIPVSSRNNSIYRMTEGKARLVVLTKNDLADPKETRKWISHFEENGIHAIFADLNKKADILTIIKEAEKLGEKKHEKEIARGMKPQPIRAMIVGIPNVGKSTLINKMANRKAASVQNKPGHTKSQQWIKVSNQFELLDTPGILPSYYKDEKDAINLALVGSVKVDILPIEELAGIGFNYMKENYFANLLARYPYIDEKYDSNSVFNLIAEKRGYLSKGKEDIEKAQKVFLNELKNGVLGQITLERI